MYKKLVDKLIELIPIFTIAAVVWLGATAYTEHKLHVEADANNTALTEALVGLIQAQQGGGGQQANPAPVE